MHGKGTLLWPDGRKYEGEFVNDKRTGKAIFHWGDGRMYEGDFLDGKLHG